MHTCVYIIKQLRKLLKIDLCARTHTYLCLQTSLPGCSVVPTSLFVVCSQSNTIPLSPPSQVLTVDARNHGDSPHSPDTSYEAMSQDLQGLLPQLGLVPCVLVGHSMGGKTAMLLALQRVSYTYLGPCNAL